MEQNTIIDGFDKTIAGMSQADYIAGDLRFKLHFVEGL